MMRQGRERHGYSMAKQAGEAIGPPKAGEKLSRLRQRQKLIDELADANIDFTVKEFLDTDPAKIEPVLMKLVPQNDWTLFSHWLIFHGRRRCKAHRPDCPHCEIAHLCPSQPKFMKLRAGK